MELRQKSQHIYINSGSPIKSCDWSSVESNVQSELSMTKTKRFAAMLETAGKIA